jgi:hypothetical protein
MGEVFLPHPVLSESGLLFILTDGTEYDALLLHAMVSKISESQRGEVTKHRR